MRFELLLKLVLLSTLAVLISITNGRIEAQCSSVRSEYESILLPVYLLEPVPGGFGSIWSTEFWVYNSSDEAIAIANGEPRCRLSPCIHIDAAQPHRVAIPEFDKLFPTSQSIGLMLYVENAGSDALSFFLRVKDESRQNLTWGTEIPVVRQRELLTGVRSLFNVPSNGRFRLTLRVYSPNTGTRDVRIRLFAHESLVPINEFILTLGNGDPPEDPDNTPCLDQFPSVAIIGEIHDLATKYPLVATADRLRIEIEPIEEGLQYWAFVSVTNNETQHVTLITPQ